MAAAPTAETGRDALGRRDIDMATSDSSGGSSFPLARQALVAALPSEIQDLLKPGKTPERINHAITWASRRDPDVLAEHRARHHAVKQFEDIRTLKLEQVDKVANHFARKFRHRAFWTGAVTGLPGGLWALVAAGADVQLTAVYAVRMAADIAQSYGYDTSIMDEQAHLAEVLALAAGIDSLRGVGNWLTREGLMHILPEVLPKILTRISVKLSEEQAAKLIGRLVPGVGAAIGGTIDYTFLRVAGERAISYYHTRYMVDHGLATPATLPPAPPDNPAFARSIVDGSLAPRPQLGVPASEYVPVPAGPEIARAKAAAQAGQPALPAAQPAKSAKQAKRHRSAPERVAIYLAIFAIFAFGITIAACAALGFLVYSAVK